MLISPGDLVWDSALRSVKENTFAAHVFFYGCHGYVGNGKRFRMYLRMVIVHFFLNHIKKEC